MDADLKIFLEQRQQTALYRNRYCHHTPHSPILQIDGNSYLSFCSNDYLGLANHPQLKIALQRGAEQYAVGSGASHLVVGHTLAHHLLEQELADFTGRERALLFSTGYMANIGTISALLGHHDAIFLDKLAHASLIDGALLSRAQLHRYPHNDMKALASLLKKSKASHKLIVTDGVFSMDGDFADLPTLVKLAEIYDAWLMVDDAHGLGVVGENGRGTLEVYGLGVKEIPILVGTLGKAFGVFGAFVAGSDLLIETLIQAARSYIYTTALPPAIAETVRESLKIAEQESWRRTRLHQLTAYFRHHALLRAIPLNDSQTPIQVILLGEATKALAMSAALYAKGIIVTAIRPPTVPTGTARLRITLSAAHTEEQIDYLLETLSTVWQETN